MLRSLFLSFSAALLLGSFSQAADRFWIDTGGGPFVDTGNWSATSGGVGGASVPVAGDSAIFDQAGTYTVTFAADAAIDLLDVDAGVITFDSSGATRTLDVTTGAADALIINADLTLGSPSLAFDLNVGDQFAVNNADVDVLHGSSVTAGGRVDVANSVGDSTLLVDNSSIDFGGLVRIGASGQTGRITLDNGANGIIDGQIEMARSSGANSVGFLDVLGGSTLDTMGNIWLSEVPNTTVTGYSSTVTVQDENSVLSMAAGRQLLVGDSGNANADALLTVDSMGVVNAAETIVQNAGELQVTNSGNFNATENLTVRIGASLMANTNGQVDAQALFALRTGGTASFSGGADLMATDIEVGIDDSAAILSFSGGGTTGMQTGSSTLQIGGAGTNTATMTVSSGAQFTTGTGAVTIGDTGTLVVQGGTFNADGPVTMSAGSTLTLNGGALNANAGLDNSAAGSLNHIQGTLTVTNGAFQPNAGGSSDDYSINGSTAANPHVVIGAGGTAAIGDDLHVGESGLGTLTVMDGGQISNQIGRVGQDGLSDGTVTVSGTDGSGNASRWTNTGELNIGRAGKGELNIEGGGVVSNATGVIGDFSSGDGTVNVIGTDSVAGASMWNSTSQMYVGVNGTGRLNVRSGGRVFNQREGSIGGFPNSDGAVLVSGVGSTWINNDSMGVGGTPFSAGGTGSLTVENQGLVDIENTLTVWGAGTVTINGGTIVLDALDIQPGGSVDFNFGVLHITGGLSISPNDSLEAALGGSHTVSFGQTLQADGTTTLNDVLTINGGTFLTDGLANSHLLQFNSGTLGFTGAGGLIIGAAGPLGATITLGPQQVIDVTDNSTIDNDGTLELAGGTFRAPMLTNTGIIRGSGTLDAALTQFVGETQVLAGENLVVAGTFQSNNNSLITLSGGHLHFEQQLFNNGAGLIVGNGTLRVDGGLTNTGNMAFSATANIIGDVTNNAGGTIISAGGTTTFFDDVVNNGTIRTNENSFSVYFGSYSGNGDTGTGTVIMEGDLKPGSSPGTMSFGGDLSFGPAAGLEIEIGGLSAGSEYDRVEVAEFASLDGTLDVSLINGFIPEIGDSFGFLFANGGFGGTFDTLNLPDIGVGKEWLLNPGGSTLFLEVRAAFSADFDLDGDVDSDDLAKWQSDYGANGNSDANGDGDSDGADLLEWQRQFGSGVSPISASASVPEPTTLLLILSAMLGMERSVRRRPKSVAAENS